MSEEEKKKSMPFAYSTVSDIYYTTFRKLRVARARVNVLESDLERYSKAMKEFGEEDDKD